MRRPESTTAGAGPIRLGLRDLPVLARIAVLWPAAAVLKRRLPVDRLAHLFESPPRGRALAPLRLARLVDGPLRRAYRRSPGYCVERSLLLFHLLRRAGEPARLHFGVAPKPGGGLAGHAWVALRGEPVAEPRDPRLHYRTTYAYPAEPADRQRPGYTRGARFEAALPE